MLVYCYWLVNSNKVGQYFAPIFAFLERKRIELPTLEHIFEFTIWAGPVFIWESFDFIFCEAETLGVVPFITIVTSNHSRSLFFTAYTIYSRIFWWFFFRLFILFDGIYFISRSFSLFCRPFFSYIRFPNIFSLNTSFATKVFESNWGIRISWSHCHYHNRFILPSCNLTGLVWK